MTVAIIVVSLAVAAAIYLTLEAVVWIVLMAGAILLLLKPLLIASLLIVGGAIGAIVYFSMFHNK
jgi:hypothetical protein